MKKNILILLMIMGLTLSCSDRKPAETAKQDAPAYQMFKTQNMWTFIKLDTRNGRMWQVQYAVSDNNRGEVALNSKPLVDKSKEAEGRFTLYETDNIFNFILLDTYDGRTWQVQWGLNDSDRIVVPISDDSSADKQQKENTQTKNL